MVKILEKLTLHKLTGLSDDEVADVLAKNPRAYMAVKGAVAEKHLEKYLLDLKNRKLISDFRRCSSDFDKDFYVELSSGKKISLECKNVQVLSISGKTLGLKYLSYLLDHGHLDLSEIVRLCKKLKIGSLQTPSQLILALENSPALVTTKLLAELPQELKESGIPRYEFSASMIAHHDLTSIDCKVFLEQFTGNPLTIDFWRTRNSTSNDGNTKMQRFYKKGEIDIVAACLFSRSMKWQFVFGKSKFFTPHATFKDRYSNKLVIEPNTWTKDLLSI